MKLKTSDLKMGVSLWHSFLAAVEEVLISGIFSTMPSVSPILYNRVLFVSFQCHILDVFY